MLDQEILDFIANDPKGQTIGKMHIENLLRDIERTKWQYDKTLKLIESMIKDKVPDEFEKLRKWNRESLETQIKEINEEIQQMREALGKIKK